MEKLPKLYTKLCQGVVRWLGLGVVEGLGIEGGGGGVGISEIKDDNIKFVILATFSMYVFN